MSTKIILVDDQEIVRDGLRLMIEKQPDMEVVAELDDGRKAIQLVQKLSPDVVIMDISMHNLNGIEATHQIVANLPGVKILALSMHPDKQFVMDMLKAGASGYMYKDDYTFEELNFAIRMILKNQTYLSPRITDFIIDDYIHCQSTTDASIRSTLTARECEVLQLLAEGKSTKIIAANIHVSIKTVEAHRKNIMDKLGVYSIAELTKYAIRERLTDL